MLNSIHDFDGTMHPSVCSNRVLVRLVVMGLISTDAFWAEINSREDLSDLDSEDWEFVNWHI